MCCHRTLEFNYATLLVVMNLIIKPIEVDWTKSTLYKAGPIWTHPLFLGNMLLILKYCGVSLHMVRNFVPRL